MLCSGHSSSLMSFGEHSLEALGFTPVPPVGRQSSRPRYLDVGTLCPCLDLPCILGARQWHSDNRGHLLMSSHSHCTGAGTAGDWLSSAPGDRGRMVCAKTAARQGAVQCLAWGSPWSSVSAWPLFPRTLDPSSHPTWATIIWDVSPQDLEQQGTCTWHQCSCQPCPAKQLQSSAQLSSFLCPTHYNPNYNPGVPGHGLFEMLSPEPAAQWSFACTWPLQKGQEMSKRGEWWGSGRWDGAGDWEPGPAKARVQ